MNMIRSVFISEGTFAGAPARGRGVRTLALRRFSFAQCGLPPYTSTRHAHCHMRAHTHRQAQGKGAAQLSDGTDQPCQSSEVGRAGNPTSEL